jgi:sulfonate transport system substrate-binding protein
MLRRQLLQLSVIALVFGIFASSAPAVASDVKEIRIGYQKSSLVPALKARQTLETAFKPLGISIKWVEFAFGPPILEGINTGNLDFGYTGDAPPVFAQAASANLVYAAALPGHSSEGIVVPEDSPIKTLADLKGKKVGFGKASSAHTTTLYALEKADLAYSDIQPVYLTPADAAAAFSRGSIDAWAIWDPYLALAQLGKVRVLAYADDVHHPNDFFLANKAFANEHPDLLAKLLNVISTDIKWAGEHRDEVAQAIHDASGIDLEAIRHSMARSKFVVVPVSDEITESQQAIADRFLKLNLLPKPVVVRDIVWKWTPSS